MVCRSFGEFIWKNEVCIFLQFEVCYYDTIKNQLPDASTGG